MTPATDPSQKRAPNFANLSQVFLEVLESNFLHRSIGQMLLFKSMCCFSQNVFFLLSKSLFSKSVSKCYKIALVFRDFDYQNSMFMPNKHDIRNQHKKLHRITYVLPKIFFVKISTVLPLSSFFPCGPPRVEL